MSPKRSPNEIRSPEYYRRQAQDFLKLAQKMANSKAKDGFLLIASEYEKIADEVEKTGKGRD